MELMLTGAGILTFGLIAGGFIVFRFLYKPAMRRLLTAECAARAAANTLSEQRARENEGQ